MSKRNDGGLAFPSEFKYEDGIAERAEGMTLRDYFAAAALPSLIIEAYSSPNLDSDAPLDVAGMAYTLADLMLAARSK